MEKTLKEQAEKITFLQEENEFLYHLVEEKDKSINNLISIVKDWEEIAKKSNEIINKRDEIISKYEELAIAHFKMLIDRGLIQEEQSKQALEIIKNLENGKY